MGEKFKLLVLLLTIFLPEQKGFCQPLHYDTALVHQMLQRITHLQQDHENDFPPGMVPSYRVWQYRKNIQKNDDNIFFTGLVVFTLRYLYDDLDPVSKKACTTIFDLASPLYKRHQNKKGRPTYNYWQTDTSEIFPNGGWLNLFNKKQALPDDMDDSSIILLAQEARDSTVDSVHHLMQNFTNNKTKQVKNSLAAYRDLKAYSTWFGKKMPVDLDFCVLTNVLYLVHTYRFPYTEADMASIELLRKAVENRDYMKHAFQLSPSYERPAILLYHLARLMAKYEIPTLAPFKPQLIKDARTMYEQASNFFDKIILSTTLMRWGVQLPDAVINIPSGLQTFTENNEFVFYIANIASMLPAPYNALLGKTGIAKFHYYSPGYNYVLLIENMVLRQKLLVGVR